MDVCYMRLSEYLVNEESDAKMVLIVPNDDAPAHCVLRGTMRYVTPMVVVTGGFSALTAASHGNVVLVAIVIALFFSVLAALIVGAVAPSWPLGPYVQTFRVERNSHLDREILALWLGTNRFNKAYPVAEKYFATSTAQIVVKRLARQAGAAADSIKVLEAQMDAVRRARPDDYQDGVAMPPLMVSMDEELGRHRESIFANANAISALAGALAEAAYLAARGLVDEQRLADAYRVEADFRDWLEWLDSLCPDELKPARVSANA